jgi:hypothetical protein
MRRLKVRARAGLLTLVGLAALVLAAGAALIGPH